MGDVGVALFNPDANSGCWNMANLVHATNKTGFSLSYAPWLRQLVDDVGFSYLSGYAKVGKGSAVFGSMRYFSLGNIQFTDFEGNPTGNFNPNEFAFDGGYATQFNNNFSMGVNLRFIYSNLTGNRAFNGIDYKAATGAAGDVNALWVHLEGQGGDQRRDTGAGEMDALRLGLATAVLEALITEPCNAVTEADSRCLGCPGLTTVCPISQAAN